MSDELFDGAPPKGFIAITPIDDIGRVFIRSSTVHGVLQVTEGPAILSPDGVEMPKFEARVVGKMGGKNFSFAVHESLENLFQQLDNSLPFDAIHMVLQTSDDGITPEELMTIHRHEDDGTTN